MDMVTSPWLRAEILRAAHRATAGIPVLDPNEALLAALPRLTQGDRRFMQAAGDDDLALLNACLAVEHAIREDQFAALEQLLVYCQFETGELEDRLLDLPPAAFARTALALYELGWIGS